MMYCKGREMNTLRDLHTHITAADRQYTPSQLVKLVKKGLDVLTVTDHNIIADGIEAQRIPNALGLYVVRGQR